jgi:hypothetical protein
MGPAPAVRLFHAFPEPPPSSRADGLRDGFAIIAANLASFGVAEVLHATGTLAWFA